MRGVGWLAIWCVACSAASTPQDKVRSGPSATSMVPLPAPSPAPSVVRTSPVMTASPSATTSPAPPPPLEPFIQPNTATGEIACGAGTCSIPEEMCCAGSRGFSGQDVSICVQARGGTAKQLRAHCEATDTGADWHGRLCDDSTDCTTGHACCSEHPDLGLSAQRCVAIPDGGKSPCASAEVCQKGTCRGANGLCHDGTCVGASVSIRCGTAGTCRGNTPVCCRTEQGPRCTARGACARGATECMRHDHCYAGQRCCASLFGTFCSGDCTGDGNTFTLCHVQADCEENTKCVKEMPTDPYGKCLSR